MNEVTLLFIIIVLAIMPTPNTTSHYIKMLGLAICLILSLSNLDWNNIIDYLDNLNEQYYLFLVEKTDNETLAKTILNLTYMLSTQPIIIGGYILFKKIRNY